MQDSRQHPMIKVLMIEDNPGDAKLVEEMLSGMHGEGFDLKWAGSLRDALACFVKERPDLVLLDLSLPDSHGIDSLVRIRENTRHTPVIIVTGIDDEELGMEAVRAGAQDFIIKGKITDVGLRRCIRYTIERKKVETKYRKSEERFKRLIEQNADGMVLVDREGKVVFANSATQSFTGIEYGELQGATFGFPLVSGGTAEIDFNHRKKGLMVAEMRVVELEWNDKMVYLASLRDITLRKKAETDLLNAQAQLIETEKIGALGTMVAGVAHELNNPMMGMLNYTQYCLKHVSETNKAFPILEDMLRETKRCIDIVNNLLTFSRMEKAGEEKTERIHCTIIIDRVINLFKYRIEKEHVTVKRSGGEDLPEIMAKPGNLQQVFLNLIGNALDAFSEESEEKDKIIQIHSFRDEGAIRIEISDNGCGIEKKLFASIFDPFLTTKPPGKGTGLGLSVCRNIVAVHNGKISFEGIPGKGSTFRVELPIGNEP